ncbi:hypothetical protein RE428_08040 [Marinobacter nanhaiticus D15-8W]|uniref:Uncharacterized protein n=1 Tax=Marinobacter nanhaiticus D15-8W TaxID=626887 RepID=N6W396_9GAMM|nr:hypothetical protein [Marinobacter nanhaiticus]ENO14574.1 hypothetical protein J057_04466 [Marinobacter nanhaiticus D15-8W]BES69741.1 hypothetical protein RE428_07590 [Marinobacter nanhaiticus D15-8W]BES69786.1 hypothetical protein RE428_08040 [Marinobacter nanhaiticus D15-8W]
MGCSHKKIEAALDRWDESHWYLHQIEVHYHNADAMRYSMNAFIRSLREIPDMVAMALQNHDGFSTWHKPIRRELELADHLFSQIIRHRRHIVHKSMLKPKSKAFVASIRGYTVKMQFGFHVDPFEDSDMAIRRFIDMSKDNPIVLQALAPDEIQVLALIREWHIEGFEEELIDSFRNAWLRVTAYLSKILVYLGGEPFPEGLPECFKDPRNYRYKKYYGSQLSAPK